MEKLDYYHEYPCKWLEFCLNVLWPLLIVVNVLLSFITIISWTSISLAILIPCMLHAVVLILVEAIVRNLDKTAYVMWYVGHAASFFCCILVPVIMIILQANSASSLMESSGSILYTVMNTASWGLNSLYGGLYSTIALALAHDFLIMFIVNAVYISARKNLFYYSYKKLRRLSAQREDSEE